MNIIKSKSSNSAIVSKMENVDKKSRSNGEIQPLLTKKRGVYVENKFTKLQSEEGTKIELNSKQHIHFKTRPMKFPSVHTTLSKLTTGTQYSDKRDEKPIHNVKQKKECQKQIETKKKYKSKILNQISYQDEKNPVIVLRSKKDVIKTPSNYSENTSNSFKWVPHRLSVNNIFDNNIYETAGNSRKRKFTFKDDPVTAVATDKETEDKKMYDLFVDVLKTTISVCKVTADCQSENNVKSNINNDSITKTSKVNDKVHIPFDNLNINNETVNHVRRTKQLFNDNQYAKVFLDYQPAKNIKKKSKSFVYTQILPKRVLSKCNSITKKMTSRESKRTRYKKFMQFLKEQLTMDAYETKEPDNLYDALKILAENKRRQERTSQFYDVSERYECEFKGRKIISPKSRRNKKRILSKTIPKVTDYFKNTPDSEKSLSSSCHSIKVYGLNYKEAPSAEFQDGQKQNIFFYNKASSALDEGFDFNSLKSSNYSFEEDIVQFSNFDFQNF